MEPFFPHDILDVAEDVRLGRAETLPVAPLGKRVRIEMAWDIACCSWVSVQTPSASHSRGCIDHLDVFEAMVFALDGSGQTTEACADYECIKRGFHWL